MHFVVRSQDDHYVGQKSTKSARSQTPRGVRTPNLFPDFPVSAFPFQYASSISDSVNVDISAGQSSNKVFFNLFVAQGRYLLADGV